MRSLRIAASVLAALTLAACAGTPDRSEQDKIVNSIVGRSTGVHGTDLKCPAATTKICSGPDSALACTCASSLQLSQFLGRNY